MRVTQPGLFDAADALPEGMAYADDRLTPGEEAAVIGAIRGLDLQPFQFHGFEGKRRVASFGWAYAFGGGGFREAAAMPAFLVELRTVAARFAEVAPDELPHALVTEYAPGAAIGWHRDRPEFGDVVGVSLGSVCRFRMRRRVGVGWERRTIELAPRSIYVLRGLARHDWEHSIPPVETMRWSVTFRAVRDCLESN